jgi:hypothetical protein
MFRQLVATIHKATGRLVVFTEFPSVYLSNSLSCEGGGLFVVEERVDRLGAIAVLTGDRRDRAKDSAQQLKDV